eukprot:1152014-Alexandrium_andersonii.AAC.1
MRKRNRQSAIGLRIQDKTRRTLVSRGGPDCCERVQHETTRWRKLEGGRLAGGHGARCRRPVGIASNRAT